MLVPSMTMREIRNEMVKDFPMVYRKMEYVAEDLKKTLDKKTFCQGYVHFFDYVSKLKNHWICRVAVDKFRFQRRAIMVYHNGHGHVGISVIDFNKIVYHTGHFFLRYNERLNLGLKDFHDIVRAYLKENYDYNFINIDCIGERIYTIFGTINSGVVAGTIHSDLMFAKMNTFLPEAILSPNQEKRLAKLRQVMEKYKDNADDLNG
jgi:hypothetical protein